MEKKIRIMRAEYPDISVPQWQGRKLRGFFAAGQEDSLLHDHGPDSRVLYRYPLVQYKVIRKVPIIVALEEGIRAVHPLIMERQELQLGDKLYPCGRLEISLEESVVGDCAQTYTYRFLSPWFGLNQENYRLYTEVPPEERKTLLERIIAGNLLSLSKGLGITVEQRLKVDAHLREQSVQFKNETVLGFRGEFSVNFRIPALFGLGKSVSRGFGTVRPVAKKRASD